MPPLMPPAALQAAAEQAAADPLAIVHDFINEAVPHLLGLDELEYQVGFDLAEWCEIITHAPRTDGRNAAFTPGETAPPDDAYWVRVSHRDGRVAGIAAGRYLDTDMGFYDYVRAGKLWWPGRPDIPVIPKHAGPKGRLAHTGGLWVSPEFAGIGLSWLLPRLNHALALTRWNLDWAIGIAFPAIIQKGITANYGAESVELMLDAPLGPGGRQAIMYALPNSRTFLIDRTWNDLLNVRSEKDHKMRDFAPFAKRKNESPIRSH